MQGGYLYVLTNPAWSGYCKIGRTTGPSRRLNQYQTGSPHRDYELVHDRYFANVDQAEKDLHASIRGHHYRGEWFHIHPTDAVRWINSLGRKLAREAQGEVRHQRADGPR